MKNKILFILLISLLIGCKNELKAPSTNAQTQSENSKKEDKAPKKKVMSPHSSAMAMVGDAHVHIDYSSPGVRDRIIFGGLLPYDHIWQAGAHMATWIETNKDLSVDGKILKAGKHGFFVIPTKNQWTLIFNTNWDQHGKDEYDEKDDVIRFNVTPKVSDTIIEHLEYKITKTNESEGTISLAWEKISISFPFKVN